MIASYSGFEMTLALMPAIMSPASDNINGWDDKYDGEYAVLHNSWVDYIALAMLLRIF